MSRTPTFISLYAGAGGLDLGFARAGFRPVFTNDISADAIATNQVLFGEAAKELSHLDEGNHEYVVGDIRHAGVPGEGSADLVIGGPPCQGFSVAGRMDPNDPRSKHVFDFLKTVERVRPKVFVMENVKALAENRRWQGIIEKLQRDAGRLGYETTLSVLNASHYGVPQARERMFLIGSSMGRAIGPPAPTSDLAPPTLRSALSSLPAWGLPGNDDACAAKVTPAKNPVLRKSPWAGMLFNGQGRPMNLDSPAPTLPASMGGNRTPIVDQKQLSGDAKANWLVEYHASLWAGDDPVASAPDHLRRITVQEASAIQSFPSTTDWQGPQSSRYRQIGNAVPPALAESVATKIAHELDTTPSRRRVAAAVG